MTEGNEGFGGTGIVEEKGEKLTKKGDKFFKLKIDGITGSLFDAEMGDTFSVGDRVQYKGTNNPSTNPVTNKEIVFHNFTNIEKLEPFSEASVTKENIVAEPPTEAVQGTQTPPARPINSIETDIHRQVFLKVSATIIEKPTTAVKVIDLAKELEVLFDDW